MTSEGFRKVALSMPLAEEGSHMDHPDFRVKGKIFATLPPTPSTFLPDRPDEEIGMVKLTPEQQRELMKVNPGLFVPAQGAWGARGCTYIRLKAVDRGTLRRAMLAAWRNTAPKRLVEEMGSEEPE